MVENDCYGDFFVRILEGFGFGDDEVFLITWISMFLRGNSEKGILT